MSTLISLGYCCLVVAFIDNANRKKETFFFDWVLSNFKTVLAILKDIDNRWFMHEDNFVQNSILYTENEYLVDHTSFYWRIVHDFLTTSDYKSQWNDFYLKYNRRLDRLKDCINENINVHMIHYISPDANDSVTQEDVNNFHQYISNINPNNKCFLHIIVYSKHIVLDHLKSNKTHIYYLTHINGSNDEPTPRWETRENYNWNIVLDNIAKIDG
jgi:hypothetical protein